MVSARFGDRYALRFALGEPLVAGLRDFLEKERIGFSFVSALGGVRRVVLGYWDIEARTYRKRELVEQLELLSLVGDTSRLDGEPHLHLHAIFGRPDYSTVGGHVLEAEASPTLELSLRAEEATVERFHDEETGLDLLRLPDQP